MDTPTKDNERTSRLRHEYDQARDNFSRLSAFIHSLAFYDLDDGEMELLVRQYHVMHEYIQVLGKRLHRALDAKNRIGDSYLFDMATKEIEPHPGQRTVGSETVDPESSSLLGRTITGVGITKSCACCDLDRIGEDCVKINVPGLGNLCLTKPHKLNED